ncbi:hypothetical protein E1267_26075 [Nonomuraea longispora]|uniref:DivIVA domain-containing protein n=1 Tax=Nonomuraea longispora TaxID=1848320 RepID=A0A4R4NAG9_9ACTN|nr:hypothetical protein [Nonomuraea longispora]TDC03512.1 hypothetical protein E1267_26075 [Nonomuraea longispora]
MLVVLAIAAIAILACVVLVSLGRGGELTEFPPDVPPLDLPEPGQLTAVDFMALQLPVNLVGYHTQSVDETLRRAAGAISARDSRIAVLEQRVSELLSSRLYARQETHAVPGSGLRTDHAPQAPAAYRELPESGDPLPGGGPWGDDGDGHHAQWRVPPRDAAVEQTSNGATGTMPAPAAPDADEVLDGQRDGEQADRPESVTEDEAHGASGDGEPAPRPVEATVEKDGGEARGEAPAQSTPGDERP